MYLANNIFKLFFATERLGNYSWLMTVRFSCNHLISGARLLNKLQETHDKVSGTGEMVKYDPLSLNHLLFLSFYLQY